MAMLDVHLSGESPAAGVLCCGVTSPGEGLGLNSSALAAAPATVLVCCNADLLGGEPGLRC